MKPSHPDAPSNPSDVTRSAPNEAEPGDADPERSWLARARQGDREAFRELVDLHRDRAYGLALRVVRSEPDAEEVAQDAFVRAWRALPGFRGDARFGTWLYRIVMRRALDRAATLRGRRSRETAIDEAVDQTAASSPPAGERAILALRMERLMRDLSEAQRTVVTLFYYEERSVDEVASTLGLPTGTVKTHLSRARAALREAWLRERRGVA